MRAVFLGSPAAAVPPLAALAEIADIALVVTNPDRPRGRSKRAVPTTVKSAAEQWGFPLAQPTESAKLTTAIAQAEADVAVVVAYGRILSAATLATTRVGFVNLHFSVLPRWRGAAPVEHAILAGDDDTGVSLMQLDEGLDTGPVVAIRKTDIEPTDTGGSLTARLSSLGADLLLDGLPAFMSGSLAPAQQIEAGVTHARRLETNDGAIDLGRPAVEIERMIRAFHPRPGAWLVADDVRIKVLSAQLAAAHVGTQGIERVGDNVLLGTRDGALALQRIQPAGKPVQTATTWMNGRRNKPATVSHPN